MLNPTLVALLALRSLATLFALQGKSHVAAAIQETLTAAAAGRNVDDHLAAIGKALENDAPLDDWQTIRDRISQEVDDFLDD